MIPLKMQIKNFLSYGADVQTIDFEPYQLICLSGKNGHGKSALLDAMTWALWGQARKLSGVAKANDGLLRLGQKQMMVTFVFSCNGQQYQICREYSRGLGNRMQAALDFGLYDAEKDAYVSVSGKSIRATQLAIDRTLHLDFDSFCNSAFLRQGQSNEFSKKSPRDRKEVLGTILGIGQYEAVRRLASEKMREINTEKISLQAVIERAQQELQHNASLDESHLQLEKNEKSLQQEESALQLREEECILQRKKLVERKHAHQVVMLKQTEMHKRKEELTDEIRQLASEWRAIHAEYIRSLAGDNVENEREYLLKKFAQHQEQMQIGLQKKEQLFELKHQLQNREHLLSTSHADALRNQQKAHEQLEFEKKILTNKVAELNAAIQQKNNEIMITAKETEKLSKESTKLAALDAKIAEINQRFDKRKSFYQHYVTQGNTVKAELASVEGKKRLSQNCENPSCPLCEQLLSQSRRRFLQQKFTQEEQFLRHRINRITRVLPQLKNVLIEQHAELAGLQKEREALQAAAIKHTELTQILAMRNTEVALLDKEHKNLLSTLKNLEEKIIESSLHLESAQKDIRKTIESDESYCALQKQINELTIALKMHQDDMTIHTQLREQMQKIEDRLMAYKKLATNIALQPERKQRIDALCKTVKEIKRELSAIDKDIRQFTDLSELESQLLQQENIYMQQRKEFTEKMNQLIHEKGSLENQRKKLADIAKESEEYKVRLKSINERIDNFQAIVAATGKDGIQALLIQDVLPEIEQEANALLARLTDNQAQIFIESLRDLKKGRAKETLDINISDGVGIRPYEMFSGGEAFRIDFALRIAISKLLASRAGTSLQTLVIDEGFGSQDEEGLSYIMDALYKIQDDFAKIIVVSHLPSMKDQFPVHFHVEKKPTGSTVSVFEQG